MEDAEARDEVTSVGVVLNVADSLVALVGWAHGELVLDFTRDTPMGVVEVICSVAKGIDFEATEEVVGDLVEQPVDDEATFDAALRVKDEDDFLVL